MVKYGFFWIVFSRFSSLENKKILKIKEIILNKKFLPKKIHYKVEDILKNYWHLKKKEIRGYAINKYTHNIQYAFIRWHWEKKYLWMKLMVENNTTQGDHIIFSNEKSFDKMDVHYAMGKVNKYLTYTGLKLRYLKFYNMNTFYLKDNNLDFVNIILNDHWTPPKELWENIELLGHQNSYDIFKINNKFLNVFLIVENQELKYFVIYRKTLSLHIIIIAM
jgi:hypothetical protein